MSKHTFTEQVRKLIDASGHSRYRIAVDCDIDHSVMSRFMAGKCGLSMASLDALAAYLDWELVAKKQNTPKKLKDK